MQSSTPLNNQQDDKASPKHTLYGPRESKESFSEDLKRQVVGRLHEIFLNHENLMSFQMLFTRYPALLLNVPLNEKNETALILAAQHNRAEIVNYLLMHGADKTHLDSEGHDAMDHAVINKNKSIQALLQSNVSVPDYTYLLIDLRKKLSDFLEKQPDKSSAKPIIKILNTALAQIDKHDLEKYYPDRILDLYYTINSVFKVICSITSEDDLQKKIKEFLSLRENVLRGDTHDYCFTPSLANEFCYQLAEIAFPDANSIPNVLLANALTEGRDTPWFDPIMMSSELPGSPGDYFRTSSNRINLYAPIVDQAMKRAKGVFEKVEDVFVTSDKVKETKEEKHQKNILMEDEPLSREDLHILAQRTATLKIFVNYVKNIAQLKKGDLIKRFTDLRTALKNADALNGKGEELKAHESIYLTIFNFAEWWHSLSRDIRDKILAITIEDKSAQGQLKHILNTIFLEFENAKDRGALRFCIYHLGRDLEVILRDPVVVKIFDELEQIKTRATEEQIDAWHKSITAELKNPCAIVTHQNIFQSLSLRPDFVKQCHRDDTLDYGSILEQYKVVTLLDRVKKLEDPGLQIPETVEIIRGLFSIRDMDDLRLLRASVANIVNKNIKKLILFAMVIKSNMLSGEKNHTVQDSKSLLFTTDFNKIFQTAESKKILSVLSFIAVVEGQFDLAEHLINSGLSLAAVLPLTQYKTQPNGTHPEPNADDLFSWLPSLSKGISVWEHLFKHKNPKLAALAVQAGLPLESSLFTKADDGRAFILEGLLGNKKCFAPLLRIAFERNSPKEIEKILQEDKEIEDNSALLGAAESHHWHLVEAYLKHRNPRNQYILNASLYRAILDDESNIATHLVVKCGATTEKVLWLSKKPEVGFKVDIAAMPCSRWYRAVIQEVKDDKNVLVRYDNPDLRDTLIDFEYFAERFAPYGSKKEGSTYDSPTDEWKIWNSLFKYKNVKLAVLLVTQAKLPADISKKFPYRDVWEGAKTKEECEFVFSYFNQISLNQFGLGSLVRLYGLWEPGLVTQLFRREKCFAPWLRGAFECGFPEEIEEILQTDKGIEDNTALIEAAKNSRWNLVNVYLKYRNPQDQDTLGRSLYYAVKKNKSDVATHLVDKCKAKVPERLPYECDWKWTIWKCLFGYENAELAALLVNQAGLPLEDDVLLTANTSSSWTFVREYLSKVSRDKLTPDFKKKLQDRIKVDLEQWKVLTMLTDLDPILDFKIEQEPSSSSTQHGFFTPQTNAQVTQQPREPVLSQSWLS